MPTNVGPNTKGEENLVFGYDLGDVKNSYKGAPVENYIHGQNAVAQDSYTSWSATSSGTWNQKHPKAIRAYNASGGEITGYYNSGVTDAANTYHAHWQYDPELDKPVVVMNDIDGQWKAKSFGTGMGSWNSYGKGYGDTYTISWLQWVDNLSKNAKTGLYSRTTTGSNGFHDGQANSPSSYNTKTHTWQRVYQTYTTSSVRDLDSNYLSIYMYGYYNGRGTVKIADVQFNWGSYPAGFHDGAERTATEGLLDLNGDATISIANAGFDLDTKSQIILDGTDDYIDLGSEITNLDTSVLTIEMVFRTASGTAGMVPLLGWHHGQSAHGYICTGNFTGHWGNESLSFYNEGTGTTPLSFAYTNGHGFLNDSQYHHIAFVLQTGAYKIFLEGEEVPVNSSFRNGSMSTTMPSNLFGYGSTPSVAVGVGSVQPYYGHIRVPICKIYNRALTASEIKANYNAVKGRFNI